jgi:CRP-like cAMP-binding protein/small-conductance mechanosensitive channel
MAHDRSRLRATWSFLALWTLNRLSSFLPAAWSPRPAIVREVSLALLELAAVQIVSVIIFDLLLRKARIPRLASEMIVLAAYALIIFDLLYRVGVNVTGIFATSAVAAAVVGLALQDMLGNIASGIALELEGGIRAGDFIRCGDISGWVEHVRLRHTAVNTVDGDIVILPNSQLTRSPVTICPPNHRKFIPFAMPYADNPQQLIDAVEFALRHSPLPDVSTDPAPQCIILELTPNHIQYAAVVWLAQPGRDELAISSVLTRLYFALERAGMPAAEISHLLEMKAIGGSKSGALNPVDVLRRTPILRLLHDADLFELASHLHHLSFAPGEHIIRQGDPGDSMYFIVSGQVNIFFRSLDGVDRLVSTMEPGDFFGEASLLTGESRTAGAVAESRVDCYRLDKAGLQDMVGRLPDLAEDMSVVMAHRQIELTTVRESLDRETARLREAEDQAQILSRIRRFFGIAGNSVRA